MSSSAPITAASPSSAPPRSAWSFELGPVAGAAAVRVLVLSGYGLNCEAETAAGFAMLGARAEIIHTGALLEAGAAALQGVHMLAFCGGFSFGDHIASGRVLANRLRFRMGDALARFVDDGGHVIGICNGFQTIAKLGLLPAFDRRPGDGLAPQQISIVDNDRLGYRNAWVRLGFDPASPCAFTRDGSGAVLEVPARHGEGKLIFADEATCDRALADHLVPLRYVDAQGRPTQHWPDNPNGSTDAAAALCDRSGRVFGVMPHPEAFLYPEAHPDFTRWRARGHAPVHGDGLGVLASGLRSVLR
ncbi:MAG: phosphoribosylformylglycinamidine synthase subunit PurQ [Deltaproteobacteria bacterium]|nr:phosphoribosylformylglycinamidine synthase subunit PurQ [Deltaproteobacteria bacterium]MBK8720173.1 phosphoribosylformylglycinamidine synthase subunit PurQ [Deltaproteobacteria bacterium]MBP7286021.1 phosphoribosylformylglycinamidine synthase subunit PurQ [Nannocystaceae bacterium]